MVRGVDFQRDLGTSRWWRLGIGLGEGAEGGIDEPCRKLEQGAGGAEEREEEEWKEFHGGEGVGRLLGQSDLDGLRLGCGGRRGGVGGVGDGAPGGLEEAVRALKEAVGEAAGGEQAGEREKEQGGEALHAGRIRR